MNHNLAHLHPYPFAKMATLLADSKPANGYSEIKLGIGEPKHEPPAFVLDVLRENLDKISRYPSTNGMFELRQTIAHWLERRFFLNHVDANTQVLPVMGTREAIFSLVQAVINGEDSRLKDDCLKGNETRADASNLSPTVVMPNPFYQI